MDSYLIECGKAAPDSDFTWITEQALEKEYALPVSYTHLDVYKRQTDNCLKYDFAKILKRIQQSSVNVPRIQFVAEPKVSLPLPPPKEAAPTDNKENPIAVTTVAATIGVIRRSQYFARSPVSYTHLDVYKRQV